MNSLRQLSEQITKKFEEISKVFGEFQLKSGKHCPPGCGQCCFKHDIRCTPAELLPLAFHLLDSGNAEMFLAMAQSSKDKKICQMLEVYDEKSGSGRCLNYFHRPFICRAFGVSARQGKNNQAELFVCSVLKPDLDPTFLNDDVPYIEKWKKQLESIDPQLSEKEIPINQAMVLILEKVLLWDSYRPKSGV